MSEKKGKITKLPIETLEIPLTPDIIKRSNYYKNKVKIITIEFKEKLSQVVDTKFEEINDQSEKFKNLYDKILKLEEQIRDEKIKREQIEKLLNDLGKPRVY